MRLKYIVTVVLTTIFLSACGGSNSPALPDDPGGDVTPPVGMVSSISITPRSTLLARLDDTHQLNAELLDEDGAMVDKPVAWTSSDPNIVAVDEQGLLTSMGTIGSASVTAEVDGVTSSPVIVAVILPALNTQFVNDDQVVGDMELVDPESQYAPGAQYRVTLTGIDVPDIGTILLARETQPIAGGVVDVQQDGDEIIVTLEVLPIDELVTSMKIDQVFVPTEDDITMSQEASEYYTMERLADGSYLFTLLPDTPIAEPVGSSVQSARTADSMVQAVRPPGSTVQAVIGTVANPFHPFDCEFSGPSFTGNAGNDVFTLQGLSPTIALEQDLSLPFVYDSALGGLQKVGLEGRVKGTLTFRNKLSVQLEGKATCKFKMLEVRFPFALPLGLVLGGQIPIGVGFELSGKVTLADMGFGITGSAQMSTVFGVTCPNGENCAFDDGDIITVAGEAKPVFDLPPGFNGNLAADLKFEPAVEAFGYADLSFGHPLFSSWRLTLANLQGGVKLGANLALVETQIDDGDYSSDYKLSTELSAKPAPDLTRLLNLLGVSQLNAVALTNSRILLTSPAAVSSSALPPVREITADVANYTVGDVVTFTVKLDPTTVNFIPTVYNVDEVMIYRDNELVAGANDPTRVERRTASNGQTEFTITWTATESGSIDNNFHAFVSTDLLPLPYFGELELGKVRAPAGTEKIAFSGVSNGNYEIYVVNPDGSNQVNLTQNSGWDSQPVWSPDGSKIAFLSDRDGNLDIYVMNADGSNQVNLTQDNNADVLPVWSPDGLKIGFTRTADAGNDEIYTMNTDGSNQVNLTPNGLENTMMVWSPDSTAIAFVSNRDDGNDEIYTMNADGSNQVNLTKNGFVDRRPAWSPDGSKIAFDSSRPPEVGAEEIYVMNTDGSGQVNLTQDDGRDFAPVWSPNGSKITFGSFRDNNSREIYVMNADGSGQVNLTPNSSSANSSPVWSADGSKIAFKGEGLSVTNADGSTQVNNIVENLSVFLPAWSP